MKRIIEEGVSKPLQMLTTGEKESFSSPCTTSFVTTTKSEVQCERSIVVWNDMDFVACDDDVEEMNIKAKVGIKSSCTELSFSRHSHLRKLTIDNECFQYIKDLTLKDMNSLETVKIGEKCFSRTIKGSFSVINCQMLKSLTIYDGSFENVVYVHFESIDAISL